VSATSGRALVGSPIARTASRRTVLIMTNTKRRRRVSPTVLTEVEPFTVIDEASLEVLMSNLQGIRWDAVIVTKHGWPMALRIDVYGDLLGEWLNGSGEFYIGRENFKRMLAPARVLFLAAGTQPRRRSTQPEQARGCRA
jgi:hypothetical protein